MQGFVLGPSSGLSGASRAGGGKSGASESSGANGTGAGDNRAGSSVGRTDRKMSSQVKTRTCTGERVQDCNLRGLASRSKQG